MPEEFDTEQLLEILKEGYPDLFKRFSAEFWEFVFSPETSAKIAKICIDNGVEDDERIEKIGYRVTLALLDQVPKKNLTEIFEKGVKLNHEAAEKISLEIERQIFSQIPKPSPVKKPPTQGKPEETEKIVKRVKEIEKPVEKPVEKESEAPDVYREPIE